MSCQQCSSFRALANLRLRLKVLREALPIDESIPTNDTNIRPLGQHIEQGRLDSDD